MLDMKTPCPPKEAAEPSIMPLYFFWIFMCEMCGVVVLIKSSRAWIQNVDSRALSEEADFAKPVETTPKGAYTPEHQT
jgi:hypothetical protein